MGGPEGEGTRKARMKRKLLPAGLSFLRRDQMARTLARLGTPLKLIRLTRGLTQAELAAKTKFLNQARISQIENSGRRPLPDEQAALAHALSVPIAELWPDEPPSLDLKPKQIIRRPYGRQEK
jgi:hypothetical protein